MSEMELGNPIPVNYEKKHKEEVVRATQLLERGDITRENLEYIFPELKESEDEESEDEKIRKDVKRAISVALDYSFFDKETANNCLAWLEKQGENRGNHGGISPKWSDMDEENLQHCCGAVHAADYYTLEDKEEMEDWLKFIKQRMEE